MSNDHVNSLPGIRRWMKRRSKHYFRNGITFLLVVCMMFFLLWTSADNTTGIKELVPLVIMFAFFLFFACYQFVLWYRSLHWNISQYWFGTVKDTYCIRNKKRKIRSYRIIADVNGKTMEGICLLSTYNQTNTGDQILLFTLDGDKVFCVHPNK